VLSEIHVFPFSKTTIFHILLHENPNNLSVLNLRLIFFWQLQVALTVSSIDLAAILLSLSEPLPQHYIFLCQFLLAHGESPYGHNSALPISV
jgi:hypothetical protein